LGLAAWSACRRSGVAPLLARAIKQPCWQLFWRIVLPLLKPLLSLVILFRGVDAFRAFDQVYSLTYGGPGRSSATLSFLTYLDFGYSRLGLASAKAYVILVVVVVGVTLYRAQVLKWFQR